MPNTTTQNPATGSQLELTSLTTEYENPFDRSNKLDNKVYITITFCGFFFVFIIAQFKYSINNFICLNAIYFWPSLTTTVSTYN